MIRIKYFNCWLKFKSSYNTLFNSRTHNFVKRKLFYCVLFFGIIHGAFGQTVPLSSILSTATGVANGLSNDQILQLLNVPFLSQILGATSSIATAANSSYLVSQLLANPGLVNAVNNTENGLFGLNPFAQNPNATPGAGGIGNPLGGLGGGGGLGAGLLQTLFPFISFGTNIIVQGTCACNGGFFRAQSYAEFNTRNCCTNNGKFLFGTILEVNSATKNQSYCQIPQGAPGFETINMDYMWLCCEHIGLSNRLQCINQINMKTYRYRPKKKKKSLTSSNSTMLEVVENKA